MKKLKYTTAHISKLVQKEVENIGGIEASSLKFNIPQDTIKLFYKNLNYFDLELYKASSKILGMPLKELTEIEEVNSDVLKNSVKYRESVKIKNNYEGLDDVLNQSINFFSLIIDNYKLGGDEI